MPTEGAAIYYDGRTPRSFAVTVSVTDAGLDLIDPDGTRRTHWQMSGLQRLPAAPGRLRLASRDHADARIEVDDPAAAHVLSQVLAHVPDGSKFSLRSAAITGGLIVAAIISVAGVVVFGIPALAAQLAPLIPPQFEGDIGRQVRPQIVALLSHRSDKAGCANPAGVAALQKATAPLIAAAGTALPIHIEVVDTNVPNAFALPGGDIIVLRGLLDKVAGPDEFIAVIAHEIGHVSHRDAMRRLIETAGLSAIVSAVIGDYTGSTLSVLVGRSLISASYSRDVEANADAFAVALLSRIGRNPRALGDALTQMTGGKADAFSAVPWLMDHPATPERVAHLLAAGNGAAPPPALDADEWAALKAICQ
jgi:Zn-dependent protease with chaperone function